MRRSRLQRDLEAGESLSGSFAPVGADFQTPGMLSWSDTAGAHLQLADLDDPWPSNFNELFTVHAQLHAYPELVSLMHCRVVRKLDLDRPAQLSGQTLAIGAHTDVDERWPVADLCPSGLHEWYPETGLSIDFVDEDHFQPRVAWSPPASIVVPISGAEIALRPGADWAWGFGPSWRIDTTLRFVIRPDEPLAIDKFWPLFRSPLLGFLLFASDRPEGVQWESFFDPGSDRQIVVLREGQQRVDREWRPIAGHFLFKAEDIDDEAAVLQRWLALWRQVEPALGYFGEFIQDGSEYSPQRFLTLYTAAEEFWKRSKKAGEKSWSLRALRDRANISEMVTHCDNDAIALMGRLRKYHAHLGHQQLSPEEIANGTFDSTRRLHVLMQACLLRELGLDTERIEELVRLHNLSWPIP